MAKIVVFFADGCEEIEGLTVVDMFRRAGIEVTMVSVMGRREIQGSHKIVFCADALYEDVDMASYDGLVLPGGMPGTSNLAAHAGVIADIQGFAGQGKLVAAICAAPSVLGQAGVLQGRHATCYPGWEEKLTGAVIEQDRAVTDGNVITSRGMGTAIDFSLAIICYLADEAAASDIRKGIVY